MEILLLLAGNLAMIIILAFVKTSTLAELLVSKGIWMKGKWLLASFLQQPATKFIIGGVLPFVPDGLIIEALSQYGSSVYPVLRKVPAAVKLNQFKGTYSFRREIYLIKNSVDTVVPSSIEVTFLGTKYLLELSTGGPKCFSCGSTKHMINKCDKPEFLMMSSQPEMQESENCSNSATMFSETKASSKDTALTPGIPKVVSTSKISAVGSIVVHKKKDVFTQCNFGSEPQETLKMSNPQKEIFPIITKKKGKNSNHTKLNDPPIKVIQGTVPNQSSPQAAIASVSSSIGCKTRPNVKKMALSNYNYIKDPPSPPSNDALQQVANTSSMDSGMSQETAGCSGRKKPRKTLGGSILDVLPGFPLAKSPAEFQSLHHIAKTLSSDFNDGVAGDEANYVDDYHDTCDNGGEAMELSLGPQGNSVNMVKKRKEDTLKNDFSAFTSSHLSSEVQLQDVTTLQPNHSSVNLDKMELATSVIEDWLVRSVGMKIPAKKRLTANFLSSHPDLENLISLVISVPGLYPLKSARGKRLRELLSEVRTLESDPRPSRIPKKKIS